MARRVIYALWSQIEGEGNGLVSAAALVSAQDKSSWIAYASPCQSDESGPRAFLRERTLASHGSSSAEPTHRPHRGYSHLADAADFELCRGDLSHRHRHHWACAPLPIIHRPSSCQVARKTRRPCFGLR